jgi:putative transposase
MMYPGALYHVINRGNYRTGIFVTDGAKKAFESCLNEVCERTGWLVHGYVLMSNHYHLALETPEPNLVEGMCWLQSTFANRFNRFRGERGHVFQGRYNAILVEDHLGLGAVAHYIHLNPVRAKLCSVPQLSSYRFGSYYWLWQKKRPDWISFLSCLSAAGGLNDNSAGRRSYQDYLEWLEEDQPAQKALNFDKMCRGWVLGGKEFKIEMIKEEASKLTECQLVEAETQEIREAKWNAVLTNCCAVLGKSLSSAVNDPKSADWKVAVAAYLRKTTMASNGWIAMALQTGHPHCVSRHVASLSSRKRKRAARLLDKLFQSVD